MFHLYCPRIGQLLLNDLSFHLMQLTLSLLNQMLTSYHLQIFIYLCTPIFVLTSFLKVALLSQLLVHKGLCASVFRIFFHKPGRGFDGPLDSRLVLFLGCALHLLFPELRVLMLGLFLSFELLLYL